jgi:hypothetical protein
MTLFQQVLKCTNPVVRCLILSEIKVTLPKGPLRAFLFALAFLVTEW